MVRIRVERAAAATLATQVSCLTSGSPSHTRLGWRTIDEVILASDTSPPGTIHCAADCVSLDSASSPASSVYAARTESCAQSLSELR